jgi:hypothetical protein
VLLTKLLAWNIIANLEGGVTRILPQPAKTFHVLEGEAKRSLQERERLGVNT